jgi:hypothetical protein
MKRAVMSEGRMFMSTTNDTRSMDCRSWVVCWCMRSGLQIDWWSEPIAQGLPLRRCWSDRGPVAAAIGVFGYGLARGARHV